MRPIFELEYALMGKTVTTADGRRAYITNHHPEKRYGLNVKSGPLQWLCDEKGRASDGDENNRIYTFIPKRGGAR